MKRAIVIGAGAGGATAAKELQGKFDVTVLEAGKGFAPLSWTLRTMESLKRTGLLLDEREIQLAFPHFRIRKAGRGLVLVNGAGPGGTTNLSAGNALRMDGDLKALGIDLDDEFAEIYREIPVTTAHQNRWRENTRRLYEICREMGLDPRPTPKMGDYGRCRNCGRCVFGCPHGVKWDSRRYLELARERGARVVTGSRVERVVIENGKATGVLAREGWAHRFYRADLVILAAGGFDTPAILRNSGIAAEPTLFVDPVLCVAAEVKGCRQNGEMPMPFVVQRDHYIMSPYFDHLSNLFNRSWRRPGADILSLMIKLADTGSGSVDGGKVRKTLNDADRARLGDGVKLCTEILRRMGVREESVFLGTVNAGHPGGMLPLTENEAESLHHSQLPANLWVADASLIPKALGNPPILTIIALAKRVARMCSRF